MKKASFLLLLAALLLFLPITAALNLDSSNALKAADGGGNVLNLTAKRTFNVDEIRLETNGGATSAIYLKVDGVIKATIPSAAYSSNTFYTLNGFNVSVPAGSYFTLESANPALSFKQKNDGTYLSNSYIGDVAAAAFNRGFGATTGYLRITDAQNFVYTTFYNEYDSVLIQDFNASIYDESLSLIAENSTTNGVIGFNLTGESNQNYTIFVSSAGYLTKNTTFEFISPNTYDLQLNTTFVPAIKLNFYDEVTKQTINNVSYKLIFENVATETNTTTGTTPEIQLNATGLLEIEYISNNYPIRHYYLDVSSQTNTSIDLYLLNENNATSTDYLITNQAGVPLTNATLSVLRRYIEDGSTTFKVVEMAKSDSSGEGEINLQNGVATYKFIINYEGNVILITNPTQIFNTNIVLRGSVGEDVTSTLYDIIGLSYTANFNNPLFELSWQDSGTSVEQVCLDVYRLRAGTKLLINNSCINSGTGSISLGIDNTTSGDYTAIASARTTNNDTSIILTTINKKIDDISSTIGVQGIFFTAILVIVAALVAIRLSPIVAILMSVAALIFAGIIGILSIGIGTIFLISAAGGVLLYAFRRGGG